MTNRKLTLKSCAVRGPAGKSAYEAAVDAGYTGTAAEYYAIIGGLPDELTRLNQANGRQDAILEYYGTQISALQLEDTGIKGRVTTLEGSMSQAETQISNKMNKANPIGNGTMTMVANTMDDGLVMLDSVATGVKLKASLGNISLTSISGSSEVPTRPVTLSGLAAPGNDNDAATKGYVDGKRFLPDGGSSPQILRIQGGQPAWAAETTWAFGIQGDMVASTTQSFEIENVSKTFAELKTFTGAVGKACPYFKLKLPNDDNVYRYLPLVHIEPDVAYFHSPAIPGVTTEAITITMNANGASGTKY